MGYIRVQNIETGVVELEVGVKPINEYDDEYVCPNSGLGFSSKPKEELEEDISF